MLGRRVFYASRGFGERGFNAKARRPSLRGKDSREEVTYIIGRIGFEELTASAKAELPSVISLVVKNREKWFVNFFNTARAITPRMHALELVPGIGKKYMWQVINERDRKPFESFEDLQKRTELPNPVKLITKRVMEELDGDSKYRLFTRAQ